VMTRLISIPVMPPGVPVVRSTRVSALICPRLRGSPAAWRVSACRVRGGVHGDSLVGGQQGCQVGHAVRGRAQAHGPLRYCVARPLGNRARVPAGGGGPHGGDDGPGSGAGEGAGVGGEFLVHGGPVGHGQAGCLFDDIHGALFVELPCVQGRQGVGHLGDQCFGHAEQPAAAVRGLAAGQRDLLCRAQAVFLGAVFAQVFGGQWRPVGVCSKISLFVTEPGLEGHRKPRLLAGGPALEVLINMDLVDQPGIVSGEVSCGEKRTRGCSRVLDAGTGTSVPGSSGSEGDAVVKRDVGKEVLVERTVRKQCFGKRVLRQRCRINGVEIIVIGQPVVLIGVENRGVRDVENAVRNRGSLQNNAVRRPRCQCRIPEAFHEHSLPRGSDIKGPIRHQIGRNSKKPGSAASWALPALAPTPDRWQGGGMAIEVRPATVFEDLKTLIGPKRPDATVCWCLSYRIPSRQNVGLKGTARGELVQELLRQDPPPGCWRTTTGK
jgi:hypothetical protein